MAKVEGKAGKVVTGASINITGATGTTTIVVTSASGWPVVGDRVLIEDVGGMTDLNGEHTVTVVDDAVSFSVVISSTAQSYTSGGTFKTCATITAWSMDIATDPIKTTDSGDSTWDEYIASGFKGASGTFDAFFETGASDITLGTSTTLILRINVTNYYSLTAFIIGNTSTTDVPGSEAVKKTYTFTASGSQSMTVA